jgi:hypothetical protein
LLRNSRFAAHAIPLDGVSRPEAQVLKIPSA